MFDLRDCRRGAHRCCGCGQGKAMGFCSGRSHGRTSCATITYSRRSVRQTRTRAVPAVLRSWHTGHTCAVAGANLRCGWRTSAPGLAKSAPGLAHICAGTGAHLRRDRPTSSPGLAHSATWLCGRPEHEPVVAAKHEGPAARRARRDQCDGHHAEGADKPFSPQSPTRRRNQSVSFDERLSRARCHGLPCHVGIGTATYWTPRDLLY